MQGYLDELDTILSNLFGKYSGLRATPSVLLSGGIDSSIITFHVSRTFPEYHIFSMGTSKTKDREFVKLMSSFLKHDFHWVDLTDDVIQENVGMVVGLLKKAGIPQSVMQVSLAMGYFLIFKAAHEYGVTHIFTGQGPDITFGGYHKYKDHKDVASEIQKDLPLLETDRKRDGTMAENFGITLINPYLEPEMIEFALKVPTEFKIKDGVEKILLRQYAKSKGLPERIVKRPKKAFQYSTGLQDRVKKYYNIHI